MSRQAPGPRTRSRVEDASSTSPEPSFRAKLEESWPLLVAGSGCVALAVVLELQRSTRTLDHLSPTFLFLAVGLTGLMGGVASFVVGPDNDAVEESAPRADRRPARSVNPPMTGTLAPPLDRWNGRPVPDVITEDRPVPPTPTMSSAAAWAESEGAAEIEPSLRLRPGTYRRPASWSRGRILHLSQEGALTVYSLEDALRDLELVDQVVHARRRTPGSLPSSEGKQVEP
jgi:hypothetical protein